jgi:hypothetical protein
MGVKPRSENDASSLVREWQASGGELVHSQASHTLINSRTFPIPSLQT